MLNHRRFRACFPHALFVSLLCTIYYFINSNPNSIVPNLHQQKYLLYEQLKANVGFDKETLKFADEDYKFKRNESKVKTNATQHNLKNKVMDKQFKNVWFTPTKSALKANTMVLRYVNSMGENLTNNAARDTDKLVKKLKSEAAKFNMTIIDYLTNFNQTSLLKKVQNSVKLHENIEDDNSDLESNETFFHNVFSDPEISIRMPTKVHMHHDVWQTQADDLEIYLYSAYYDDRPALQRHQLRIIAVAETRMTNLVCLIWYENQEHPDISRASKKEVSSKISPLLVKQYEAYIFSCNMLPEKNAKPTYVSVVTTSQKHPTNRLEVRYPIKLPEQERIEFGHCMSVIYWKHHPYRIVEWLEIHKLWGVGEVNIYANTLSQVIRKIFKYYANEGFVNIHEITSVIDDKSEWTILLDMSPAINDCLYKNMYRYKNVVCTDTDEMIVPIMHRDYSSMIQHVNQKQDVTHPAPSYIFRNVYFFTDFGPIYRRPIILHTQRYTKHVEPSVFGYSAKSITNPQTCIGLQNHICWKRITALDKTGWLVDVPLKYGQNFHYKKCHFDDYLRKEGECAAMMRNNTENESMRRFGDQLFPIVRDVLLKLQLL